MSTPLGPKRFSLKDIDGFQPIEPQEPKTASQPSSETITESVQPHGKAKAEEPIVEEVASAHAAVETTPQPLKKSSSTPPIPPQSFAYPDKKSIPPQPPAPLPPERSLKAPPLARGWGIGTWIGISLIALLLLIAVVDAYLTIAGFYAISPALGMVGTVLGGVFLILVISLIIKEWRGLRALMRMQKLRALSNEAVAQENPTLTREAITALESHYQSNPGAAAGQARFLMHKGEGYTPSEELVLFEREVLAPLDAQAVDRIANAGRDSAIFTTLSPFAALDMGVSLWRNLKMIREVAGLYGAMPGWWQTVGLMRRAFVQMVIAGGLEAGDGLAGDLLGHGIAGRLSAKLSQGVVNGLMTVRLGVATVELCRPAPFIEAEKPKIRSVGMKMIGRIKDRIAGSTS